jgi:hypothetical protein
MPALSFARGPNDHHRKSKSIHPPPGRDRAEGEEQVNQMPRLTYSSEKLGCGATIELDNGDSCMISVARTGVLVRSCKKDYWSRVLGSFFGPILYNEKNVYRAAKTAAALDSKYPQVSSLKFQNPVLTAFASAVWSCSSAAEVAVALNEAADLA